jgi:hypothetical protein
MGFCGCRFAPDVETLESYASIRALTLQGLAKSAARPVIAAVERRQKGGRPPSGRCPRPGVAPGLEDAVHEEPAGESVSSRGAGRTAARRHDGTPARRHDGTTARQHASTTARRHASTPARQHDGTTARRHDGTPEVSDLCGTLDFRPSTALPLWSCVAAGHPPSTQCILPSARSARSKILGASGDVGAGLGGPEAVLSCGATDPEKWRKSSTHIWTINLQGPHPGEPSARTKAILPEISSSIMDSCPISRTWSHDVVAGPR